MIGGYFEPSMVAQVVIPTLRRPREEDEVWTSLICAVGLLSQKETSEVALNIK
jgi:hypothetical protein